MGRSKKSAKQVCFPVCRCGIPRRRTTPANLSCGTKLYALHSLDRQVLNQGLNLPLGRRLRPAQNSAKKKVRNSKKSSWQKTPTNLETRRRINVPRGPWITCYGGSSPKVKNGSSAGKPATLEYDQPATGSWACENTKINETTGEEEKVPIGPGITTEKLKTIGYEGLEVINTLLNKP